MNSIEKKILDKTRPIKIYLFKIKSNVEKLNLKLIKYIEKNKRRKKQT